MHLKLCVVITLVTSSFAWPPPVLQETQQINIDKEVVTSGDHLAFLDKTKFRPVASQERAVAGFIVNNIHLEEKIATRLGILSKGQFVFAALCEYNYSTSCTGNWHARQWVLLLAPKKQGNASPEHVHKYYKASWLNDFPATLVNVEGQPYMMVKSSNFTDSQISIIRNKFKCYEMHQSIYHVLLELSEEDFDKKN